MTVGGFGVGFNLFKGCLGEVFGCAGFSCECCLNTGGLGFGAITSDFGRLKISLLLRFNLCYGVLNVLVRGVRFVHLFLEVLSFTIQCRLHTFNQDGLKVIEGLLFIFALFFDCLKHTFQSL